MRIAAEKALFNGQYYESRKIRRNANSRAAEISPGCLPRGLVVENREGRVADETGGDAGVEADGR